MEEKRRDDQRTNYSQSDPQKFRESFHLQSLAKIRPQPKIEPLYMREGRSSKGGTSLAEKGLFCVAPGSRNLPFTYTPGN